MTRQAWTPAQREDGTAIPATWRDPDGYLVYRCLLPQARFYATRPKETDAFASSGDRTEIVQLIEQDKHSNERREPCSTWKNHQAEEAVSA